MEVANTELQSARKNGDFLRSGKIQKVLDTVEKLSKPPAEIEFLESLLTKTDETEIRAALTENRALVTDEFKALLDSLIKELEQTPDTEPGMIDRIKLIKNIIKQ